jgi:hypothetical protein
LRTEFKLVSLVLLIPSLQIAMATSLLSALGGEIKSAARVDVVLEKLQKLTDAAKSLRQEFSQKALPDYRKSTLQAIYAEFFNPPIPMPGPDQLSLFLACVLEATIATSELMAEELKIHPAEESSMLGFSQGEIWALWINMVTTIMKDSALPYEARKDSDKRKSDSPSPFVALVRELQKSLPIELQKSTQSDDALAQAIYRARHGVESALGLVSFADHERIVDDR